MTVKIPGPPGGETLKLVDDKAGRAPEPVCFGGTPPSPYTGPERRRHVRRNGRDRRTELCFGSRAVEKRGGQDRRDTDH